MCLPIVFQQCDFDFAGYWHAEAVEEYEEEESRISLWAWRKTCRALVHFCTLVTLRRVRVRVGLELRLGLVRVRIRERVRLELDLGLGLC